MRYGLGVDGGATKTVAVVGDETGRVLGAGLGGPSNYQLIGLDAAMENVDRSVRSALSSAGLGIEQVEFAVFGLSGADFPVNYSDLTGGLQSVYPGLRFDLVNDAWVGFRAGTEKDFGGVVISGTGANFAARGPDGRSVTGRGIDYEWGVEGGAGRLIKSALHFAFRSHDGTGPRTGLEEAVLQITGFSSYDELSFHMYQVREQFSHIYMKVAQIVPALFELAFRGDRVCQDILTASGEAMGEIIGRMMANLGMGEIPADVALVGSLFTKGVDPLLVSSLKLSCQRFVPLANFRFPDLKPAGGGYLMALEKMGVDAKGDVRRTAIKTLPVLE